MPGLADRCVMTEETRLIQGKEPGSLNELRVANALDKYKIEYIYQYPIQGGYKVRGGQIIDFLLLHPWSLPLQVFGEYWHEGELRGGATIGLAVLRSIFHREPIVIWGSECETQEAADDAVRRKVL